MSELNENAVIKRLIEARFNGGHRGIVVPRYTPREWWECDVAHLTDAGYLTEYEIKLSRSDFIADEKKRLGGSLARHTERRLARLVDINTGHSVSAAEQLAEIQARPTKHQMLANGSTNGPNRFYFVAPAGVLAIEQIPEWAGFIELSARSNYPSEVRRAPRLHMLTCCYHRFINKFVYGATV